MLRRTAMAGLLAGGTLTTLGLTATPAFAGDCSGAISGSCGDTASAGSSGHQVIVSVSGSFVGGGSGGSGGRTSVSVPSPCWYTQGYSGAEYYEWVESGRANQDAHHADGSSYTPRPGYKQHKDDTEGHYYGGECSSGAYEDIYGEGDNLDAFFDYTDKWFADHDAIWVGAGQEPPTPPLPPETLRYAAQQAMTIPEPHFAFNPDRAEGRNTIVNIPTWFWLTDPTLTGDVTASAGGHSATVTASLTSFKVVSDDGDSTGNCPGTGTAWQPGADTTGSDCAITFRYPAAGLGVTATTRWGLSWSYDGAPQGALDPVGATWTDALGVGEVQTVVTDAR